MAMLTLPALAEEQAPACCAKPAKEAGPNAATQTEKGGKLKCSLTGKVVEKCCCEERDGKTYCTLAKKNVDKCCCSPVASDAKPSK
jgi:hypothetical protein